MKITLACWHLKNMLSRPVTAAWRVQIFPVRAVLRQRVPECIGNLQKGVLECFSTTVGGTGNFFGPAQVLDLPYVFDNDAASGVCA